VRISRPSNPYVGGILEVYFTRTFGLFVSYAHENAGGASVPISLTNPQAKDSASADSHVLTFGWRMGNWY
jgi:hypothetical protein